MVKDHSDKKFNVILFNDALNTFLINGYIGVWNILIRKIPSGYLTGIDLRSSLNIWVVLYHNTDAVITIHKMCCVIK